MTLGLFVSAASSSPQAAAQAIGETSPLDSSALGPEEDMLGLRAGAFRVHPSAALTLAYDSNVFAAPAAREAHALVVAEAHLQLANEPAANAVAAHVFVRERRFDDISDQNTTEYGASAALGRQIDEQDEISLEVLAQRRFESRVDIETPNFREVSFYQERRGEVGYSHVFNRLALSSQLSGQALEYENVSQRFRNRSHYRGEVRGDYDLRNGLLLNATGYYSVDDYHHPNSLVASAKTVGTLVGGRWSTPQVIDFELAAGYFHRAYADQLGEISDLAFRGSTVIHVTPLLTIRAEVVREDAPTRIPGAFGKVETSGRLDVRHEYSRTIELRLQGQVILDDFDNTHRTDKTVAIQTGIAWSVSRRAVISAEYDYATRLSDAPQEEFARHVLGLSLTGQF